MIFTPFSSQRIAGLLKLAGGKKALNIRIPEKEESHTFFLVGHRFQGVADQEPHPSAPHAQQPWGWVAKHHMGVPRGYPSWCDVHLLPWYTGSPLGVTKPPLWPFGERERKKEIFRLEKSTRLACWSPSETCHLFRWLEERSCSELDLQEMDDFDFKFLLESLSCYPLVAF